MGSSSWHYPTLKEARTAVGEYEPPENFPGGHAVISRCKVAELTKEVFCNIIDSDGGRWCIETKEHSRIYIPASRQP